MTEENVVPLPTKLERLAAMLKSLLTQEWENKQQWVEIQIGICLTLVVARDEFPVDIKFGQWCNDNGFGEDVINSDKRAAAITMGRDPDALRKCLEATDRRSLLTIYRYEFSGFRNVSKPVTSRKNNQQPRGDKLEKAKDAYDELSAAGKATTVNAICDAASVSDKTAKIAIAIKTTEAELDPLTPADMRETMRKRFDIALRKAKAEMRQELMTEINAEYQVYIKHLHEKTAWADKILAGYKGVISRDAFRKIKACLHPDHNTFKFAAEALQTFSELERVLVKPDPAAFSGAPLPTTAADLLARRRRR